MTFSEPQPYPNELPSAYAHRIGQWYATWNKPYKAIGQYFTPLEIARFMARMLPVRHAPIRALDPGAGFGILSCALCEVMNGDITLVACEVDHNLIHYLNMCLRYAQQWMHARNRSLTYTITHDDFVLAYGSALDQPPPNTFDVVISNPPYFKLAKTDMRARIADRVVYGQPNIYALFMAVSAALLNVGGHSVFITPRSYTAGQYFSRFRQYFFGEMRPRAVHVFESRRDMFDDVLQENIILLAERSTRNSAIQISTSADVDFSRVVQRTKLTEDILDADQVMYLPLSEQDDAVIEQVRSWEGRLWHYGMQISTGPVVPFRAAHHITPTGNVPETHVPLLWMQNVKPMCCSWPVSHKAQYLSLTDTRHLLLPNQNYVLLRRFSAKEERQRLTAAAYLAPVDAPAIGLENHLNYIYRPDGRLTADEALGLAVLLNSQLMDAYFRLSNGNTQVSATELRKLPLPPLETIVEMGRLAAASYDLDVDRLTNEVLGFYA